jgi:hypothetical protein
MDSSVWLTEQGGKEWEKAFSIRWEFYFDVILSDAFPNCLEVKATRESICRDAASFYRGCAAERGFRLEGGSPVGGENWKWSNWKNHKRYFSSRLVVEAPNPQPESCGLIYCPRAEALRAPWRAPA